MPSSVPLEQLNFPMYSVRFILTLASFAATSAMLAGPAFAQLNDGVPSEVQGVGVEQKPGSQLPLATKVVDANGRDLRLGHFFNSDRPVLVTLNYSDCPMLCSLQLNQLVKTLDDLELRIGTDFDLLTLSIDPAETTRKAKETKDKYVAMLPNQPGAAAGWHFVTASQPEITAVTDALGFNYRYDRVSKEYYHPAMLAFVSPKGVVTRYSLDVAFPERQMRLAIVDASDGKVGSVVDQFIMLCFRYDSERNRYVASAWKIMRLGGFATVAILVVTLTPFWLGRKRNVTAVDADEEGVGTAPDPAAKVDQNS